MQNLNRTAHLLTDLFFVCFGSWSLVELACYFLDLSFHNMVWIGSSVMIVFGIITWYFCRIQHETKVDSRLELFLLVIFVLIAVLLTICLNRPDVDDKTYLSIALGVLDFPNHSFSEVPSFDIVPKYYLMTSYEMFRAAISYVTGMPILISYYLVVPGFFAIFVVLTHWRLLRVMSDGNWIAGLTFLLLLMIAWGDVHRTHANFGLVRMFQGKACFVSIVVPGMLFYFYKFMETSSKKYIVLLIFTMVCGVGFSPTGVSVGTMTLVLLLFCNFKFKINSVKQCLYSLLPCVLPLLIGGVVFFKMGVSSRGVHTAQGVLPSTTTLEMITFVMGKGLRGGYAMFCLLISPFLINNNVIKVHYRNYVIICLILLAFPWTSDIVAKLSTSTGSWRWLWCIPFPAIMALVASKLFSFEYKSINGSFLFIVLCLSFYFAGTRNIISLENYTTLTWPSPKIAEQNRVILDYYKYGVVKNGRIYLGDSEQGF